MASPSDRQDSTSTPSTKAQYAVQKVQYSITDGAAANAIDPISDRSSTPGEPTPDSLDQLSGKTGEQAVSDTSLKEAEFHDYVMGHKLVTPVVGKLDNPQETYDTPAEVTGSEGAETDGNSSGESAVALEDPVHEAETSQTLSRDEAFENNSHHYATEEIQLPIKPEHHTNDEEGTVVKGEVEANTINSVLSPHSCSSPRPWKKTDNQQTEIPRGPRQVYGSHTHRHGDPPELVRIKAQLMRAHEQLDAERQKYKNMHKSIARKKQEEMDAALSSMMMDLLHKQSDALAQQSRYRAKEADLKHREKRIEQLELYLSKGQKILHNKYEGEAVDCLVADIKADLQLQAKRHEADLENKIDLRAQALELEEASQQMRAKQYKALISGSLEAEIREKIDLELQAELVEEAEIEYNRGFDAGKEIGRNLGNDEAHQRGFYDGYAACHKAQVTLSELRAGHIPRDSPELDFLYDATHPHHLINCGRQMGPTVMQSPPPKSEAKMAAPEKPVHRFPPARPTLASELRGEDRMHNGQYVLANGGASPLPASVNEPVEYKMMVDDLIDLS